MEKITDNPKDNRKKVTDPVQAEPEKRKRGRPKGSIDKTERKTRKDNTQFIVAEDDRIRMMKFNRILMKLSRITDKNNPEIMQARIDQYLQLCEDNRIMPTVSGLALSFGINRATLWDWISNTRGTVKNAECVDILKTAYAAINTQYEELLTEGKMIPVSAFFLLQNNHGYKNQTDHVIQANTEQALSLPDITQRAGLLEE